MLRKSDFTLVGKVDRLEDFEKEMLIDDIYFDFNNAVKAHIEDAHGNKNGAYYLYNLHNASFQGRKNSLAVLRIKLNYQGEKHVHPLDVVESIAAEFRSTQQQRA